MKNNTQSLNNALGVLGPQNSDKVLIISDPSNMELAKGFLEVCREQKYDCQFFDMGSVRPYSSVPDELVTIIKELEPQIALNLFLSVVDELSFRINLLREEQLIGAKIGHILDANMEVFQKYMTYDFNEMVKTVLKFYNYLTKKRVNHIKVTTNKGTDLDIHVSNRNWHTDVKVFEKGSIANFPCGEVYIAPIEERVNGLLIADVAAGDYQRQDEPTKLVINDGIVDLDKIDGPISKELQNIFSSDEMAKLVGEFGIGFNKNINTDEEESTVLLEKAYGTAHLAFGSNEDFGGENRSDMHMDFVFKNPDIYLDGRKVVEQGTFINNLDSNG